MSQQQQLPTEHDGEVQPAGQHYDNAPPQHVAQIQHHAHGQDLIEGPHPPQIQQGVQPLTLPTPHPAANHPAVQALYLIPPQIDEMDEAELRDIIRAAADVLYAGHPQCRAFVLNDDDMEERCTARA